VTVNAIDFYCGARFPVDFAVAMIVLRKMAIVTLHPFFQMNVRKMHRF